MTIKNKKVAAPPSQATFTGGEGNNQAEPVWKNWMSDLHSTLEDQGLLDTGGAIPSHAFMSWQGTWNSGVSYGYNSVVVDHPWTAICVNPAGCTTKPAPQYTGAEEYDHDGVGFSQLSYLGLVKTAHEYTFNQTGEVQKLEILVPATGSGIQHEILVVDKTDPDNPKENVYKNPALVGGSWSTLVLGNRVVTDSSVFTVILYTLDSSSNTVIQGNWGRASNSNNTNPGIGDWNRDNNNSSVKINHTDDDGGLRQGDLESMIPGTRITFTDNANASAYVTYDVVDTNPAGTHVQYAVVQDDQGSAGLPPVGATCTMSADIPVPNATAYYEEAGGWGVQPSFATVVGAKEEGGTAQQGANDVYGIRLQFRPMAGTGEWAMVAHSS